MDPSVATFVDIVHTMGGPVLDGYLAIYDVMGTVDFYANVNILLLPRLI